MKIFGLYTDMDKFKYLGVKPYETTEEEIELYDSISLTRVKDVWNPITLKLYGKGKRGDCPYLIGHLPVFSEKIIGFLDYLIHDSVEYLPINCPGNVKYYIVNVLKVVDCIDYDKAKIERYYNGEIRRFEKFAFKKELLQGIHIFKTPELAYTLVFVSEEFVNKANEFGLLGFDFEEVE
jgi:hypothetical protein